MAKREQGFGWVREDVEGEARDWPNRRDRTGDRALRDRTETLAIQLSEIPLSTRRRLPLNQGLLDAIAVLAGLGKTPARRRQMQRVASLLRHIDLDELDAAIAGDTPHAQRLRELESWRSRLVERGDPEVMAFLEVHPGADGRRIRQAVLQARRGDAGSSRANKRLFVLLRESGPETRAEPVAPEVTQASDGTEP